ncbi:MAG: type II toxin-antitoxin system HipA family toxin [Acidimicrobiaceae bacterium]|nr:type II toxin-antitoxin system HipA family toxin [Acidimicrobiaceae bacterium]MXZ64971.1 type II toxin-antitoxin system HipA family toxin [Acidimicrobiaceae bacterium]MYF33414.1 type II toxin-antitoxin system HipA family toxin [Acidimicrobiaceae bacterium]MYG78491.1 type II toxin-antitoxin system HipA family toxin [Acidimicrobiaceae bacterium]MYJ84234.1 type II toxin-antitoxin system HipA family toxin [Acidimicrobiaceae bacterium]
MTAQQLEVLMSGVRAGHVTRPATPGGPWVFTYDDTYANGPAAVPMSLSMPLQQRRFADARVRGWMAGLLPGHSRVLKHWAAKHGAASIEPFDLLATRVGLECAGAVQFCDPETTADELRSGGVDWLTSAQTEEMVTEMVDQAMLWGRRLRRSAFSLAGAFAKTALYRDDSSARRWGEPHGSHPSTHILKVPMPDQPEQAINEHLCLTTARYAGLATASTELQTWAGHTVVIVKRFDRIRGPDGVLRRVHQEDLHQAAGDYEAPIYQGSDNAGHDPATLARLLRQHSTEPSRDVAAFFDALAFNWLICNTDAHAKNYSILLGPNTARLTPLYDIWSIMPEDPHHYEAWALAMSALKDHRILAANSAQTWRTTAAAVGLNPSEGVERVEQITRAIPDALARAIDELDPAHRTTGVVAALSSMVPTRTTRCLSALANSTAAVSETTR